MRQPPLGEFQPRRKGKSMAKETGKKSVRRRDFLRLAGLGGVAGAAAVAGATGRAEAGSSGEGKSSSGYRETDHVKKFYELSRF